ncbi:hypothetical protein [Kamptonema sp. UHCC 0994]|uniref:hypothetical protein n=1 Tax=Kamptonema sp. UHCC 0994 TaxID=3031329 RepID=UPI0023B9B3D5|nr:hypothetical protein [Kamptonema sp. UHCC 0994]MDF0555698.1 hypothetical protein [Kamptonema sp. UHCC 0994]
MQRGQSYYHDKWYGSSYFSLSGGLISISAMRSPSAGFACCVYGLAARETLILPSDSLKFYIIL